MTSAWQEDLQRPFRRNLSRVPELTVLFWLVTILLATVGDTAVDLFTGVLGLGITTMLITTVVAVLMVVQSAMSRYIPWLYWLVVMVISIFGTLIADNLIDIFDISPQATTVTFAVLLVGTFMLWHAVERTLSPHTINTTRRETFYWFAVLFTFALGAAASDLGIEGLGAEYGAVLIAAIWAAHRFFRLNAVFAFWTAYVIARPFGGALGDLVSRHAGKAATTVVFLGVVVAVVCYLSISHRDEPAAS